MTGVSPRAFGGNAQGGVPAPLPPETIPASINVRLRPWKAPNFAVVDRERHSGNGEGIPLDELSLNTLNDLTRRLISDIYNAARKPCPWYRQDPPTNG